MYSVEIETPFALSIGQKESLTDLVRETVDDWEASVRFLDRFAFRVTVTDDLNYKQEELRSQVVSAIFTKLFDRDYDSREQLRRAKIEAQTQLLSVIEECAVTDDITETVFTVLTEKITGCMENLWKLCNESWQEVCKELTKRGLEDFMERHLGEGWA